MVEVFAEVRRVLRSDGTLWANLGDSYAGAGYSNHDMGGGAQREDGGKQKHTTTVGLKPKDLCGIPWRLAFALQQPHYTGTINDVQDRIWLAAMIDAEGCMFIHKRKAGQNNGQGYERQNDNYAPGLEIANTSEAIIQRCLSIVGKGSICSQSPDQNNRRKQTIYRYNLRTIECRDIIREVYPHLVGKQHQARLALGCPSSGPDADAAHRSLMLLHNGGTATIDFPAPKSMFEPGWYLRQDIIWKKPNPMPESVTDRCTKAHEYVFLMTKSASYYYDNEAIKTPITDSSINRLCQDVENQQGSDRVPGKTNGNMKAVRFGGNKLCPDTRLQSGNEWNPPVEGTLANKRSVWTVPTATFSEAHFATFPPNLIKPCILAGTSARGCCPKCGAPWERVVEDTAEYAAFKASEGERKNGGMRSSDLETMGLTRGSSNKSVTASSITTGWQPTCECGEASTIPCTVLDPFFGSGTVGQVSLEFGRRCIGIELNPQYVELAKKRCDVTPGLCLA